MGAGDGFGLGLLGVLVCLTDFDRRCMRVDILAGVEGVGGGIGVDIDGSTLALGRLVDKARGRLASATALSDLPEKVDVGGAHSSVTGNTAVFSDLFLANMFLKPPLESFLCTFGWRSGIRLEVSSTSRSISGGRSRRVVELKADLSCRRAPRLSVSSV